MCLHPPMTRDGGRSAPLAPGAGSTRRDAADRPGDASDLELVRSLAGDRVGLMPPRLFFTPANPMNDETRVRKIAGMIMSMITSVARSRML